MKRAFFDSIRAKLIGGFLLITIPIIVFVVIAVSHIKMESRLYAAEMEKNAAIQFAAGEAIAAAHEGMLVLHKAQERNDLSEMDALYGDQKVFEDNSRQFELFIKALTWGSQSEAFTKSQNGEINKRWNSEGFAANYTVPTPEGKVKQLAGMANIYYSAFVKYGRKALKSFEKELAGKSNLSALGNKEIVENSARQAKAQAERFEVLVTDTLNALRTETLMETGRSQARIEDGLNFRIASALIVGIFIFMLVFSLEWILLTKLVVKPLEMIIKSVRRISRGEMDVEIEAVSGGEIRRLALDFNRMIKNLKKTTVSRDALKQEVEERKHAEEALKRHTAELEKLNKVMVGRELRMVQLKEQIQHLKGSLAKETTTKNG